MLDFAESERIAIMGVVSDGSGGALVSDSPSAPSRDTETDGAESEIHTPEMETTPITEDAQVSFGFVYVVLFWKCQMLQRVF